MTTEQLLIAAVSFSLSQILLSGVLLIRSPLGWSVQKSIYSVFLVAITFYLLMPFSGDGEFYLFVHAAQTAIPGMFWLFSASLFDDHFRLRLWQVTLVAITVLMPTAYDLFEVAGITLNRFIFYSLPQGLEFVLLGLALVAVVSYWHDDLVASRRRLRVWFSGLAGVYITTLMLMREILFAGEAWLSVWQYVPVGFMLLVINIMTLEYIRDGLFHQAGDYSDNLRQQLTHADSVNTPSTLVTDTDNEFGLEQNEPQIAAIPNPVDVCPELLAELNRLMQEENVYREMGLTIGQLASKLGMREYRLRKMINAGMGYRNFNDFLNTFRIREARQRLADKTQSSVPVLNIALDAGYRSLSSFNSAFKETLGQTPTEFRASV